MITRSPAGRPRFHRIRKESRARGGAVRPWATCARAGVKGPREAGRDPGGGSWRAQLVWRFYPRGVSLLFMCILSVLAQVTTDCIMTVLTLIL